MKHLLRPHGILGCCVLLGLALGPGAGAQAGGLVQLLQGPSAMLLHSSSQGYLGVDLADVDQDKAQTLKLKEVRGAIVTLIDHDAPAGQIGLKVNDVVLALNGQAVESAEQLRRMLKELPAGRKVSLEISRDGNLQTLAVQLADRRTIEHDARNNMGKGNDTFAQGSGMGILVGDGSLPGMFHMPIFGSSLNVGALVEPLTSQMAEYLGVPSGLMVKQVARKSEAATAGLKAFDIILKVGADPIPNLSSWDRALRANQGKPVPVTILRDRKQLTVTLQVDSKHKSGLEDEELFPDGNCPALAEIDPELASDALAEAETLRQQAQTILPNISQEQVEALRKQAEALRDSFKAEDFKIDRKQLDELKQQMEEWRKTFNPEDFKIDPQQMQEFRHQMDQFKRQMEEWKQQSLSNPV